MDNSGNLAIVILLGIVALFVSGLLLGFIALKWRLLERLVFNSIAILSPFDMSLRVGLMILLPPLLTMVAAWYVLVAAGRTDPIADE